MAQRGASRCKRRVMARRLPRDGVGTHSRHALISFRRGYLARSGARYRAALAQHYAASSQVAYASKAYLCTAIAQLFAEEGLDLDVVSGGELHVALRAGFPPERVHFHGNNKTLEELRQALDAGVGRIVVDNFRELTLLAAGVGDKKPASDFQLPIWLRLAPGIAAHTHAHIQTGQEDTKFGFSIAAGAAEAAVLAALGTPGLRLLGLHAHIGSQIYEPDALAATATRLIEFAAALRHRYGWVMQELSPGGGWGVPMTESDPEAPIEPYIAALAAAITAACQQHRLDLPHLVLEPGRSLVARGGRGALSHRRAQGDPRRADVCLGGWRDGR